MKNNFKTAVAYRTVALLTPLRFTKVVRSLLGLFGLVVLV